MFSKEWANINRVSLNGCKNISEDYGCGGVCMEKLTSQPGVRIRPLWGKSKLVSMLSKLYICVCTCVSPLLRSSALCAHVCFFAFGRAGITLTRMSTLSSDMLVYCGSKCAYTSLRMCQSLCAFMYISNPLTCLSVLFCVLGCVCVWHGPAFDELSVRPGWLLWPQACASVGACERTEME